MDYELRTFTIEEANRLIPELTTLILELQAKQEEVFDLEVQIDAQELIENSHKGNLPSKALKHLLESHHTCVGEFYAVVERIHQHGCLLKDVQLGLVDFYAVLNGKVIYLCWQLGEEKVAHWHEVGKGYTNREALPQNLLEDPKEDTHENES